MKTARKKIGILTCHYYPNFGSTLQAIALQEIIKTLGYDVKLINYRNPKHLLLTSDATKVVLQGLDGYILSEKGGQILVCKKSQEQSIKEFSAM